jgi:1,2-dihydroxy-3-keto-5-methylthiopentene dioxygenase
MAIVKIVDEDRVISGEEDVRQYLAGVGIEYERWELSPEIDKDSSSEAVLAAYAEQVERVKRAGGYAKVDVVNVNSSTPGINAMVSKFSAEHWHDEDEVPRRISSSQWLRMNCGPCMRA